MLTAIMMLRHLGEADAADRTRSAIDTVLLEKKIRTRDLGGTASTDEFADAIVSEIGRMAS